MAVGPLHAVRLRSEKLGSPHERESLQLRLSITGQISSSPWAKIRTFLVETSKHGRSRERAQPIGNNVFGSSAVLTIDGRTVFAMKRRDAIVRYDG